MKLLLRFLGFLFAAGTIVFVVGVAAAAGLLWHFSKDLPDYSPLQDYDPAVMTRVHAADGSLVAEYARTAPLHPDPGGAQAGGQRIPLRRGQEFLRTWWSRFHRHSPRRRGLSAELRIEPASAGRLNHYATSRQELPADKRTFDVTQGQGGAARAQDRAHLQQGKDPRALLERNLPGPWCLWHCRSLSRLLRQGCE